MLSDQSIRSVVEKKKGFTINPPCENIQLDICKNNYTELQVHLRPDSQGFVSTQGLADGIYGIIAYCLPTKPFLPLHKFQISITHGDVDVQFVDVGATVLHVTFKRNDERFDGAEILGTFGFNEIIRYSLIGQTDNQGVIQIPLSECSIVSLSALRNKIPVNSCDLIHVPEPSITPVNIPRQPRYIIIDDQSSSFSSCLDPIQDNDVRIVVLTNITRSTMLPETYTNILKRSYWEILEKCQKNRWNISLAITSANTSVEWCTPSWIQSNQTNLVKTWIDREAYYRTDADLCNAMNECMKRHPNVTDVYTMCSDSVYPFYYCIQNRASIEPWGPQCILWNDYRKKFPQVKFHFIAFGEHADRKSMEAMSMIGNGIYHQITLPM